jgi:hypothetical protein
MLYLFALPVSALTLPVDCYLAQRLPLALRAPLTAVVGGTIAVGLLCALAWAVSPHGATPQCLLTPFAIGGALSMGLGSVLSSDYGGGGAARRRQ